MNAFELAILEAVRASPELRRELAAELGIGAAEQEPEPTSRDRLGSRQASRYLTVAEAAELLRCKPQRIHDLLSMGRLTRCKEGGRTLVIREEVAGLVVVERTRRLRAV